MEKLDDKKKLFNDCVKEAKKITAILKLKNQHRIKIASLALKACTIKHGGKAKVNRMTLKKFAEQIGVNRQTLSEWVRYKVLIYDKLSIEERKKYNSVSSCSLKDVITSVDSNSTNQDVSKVFNNVSKRSPIDSKLRKYSAVMGSVIYNLSSFMRSIEVPDEILLDYKEKSKAILELIDEIEKNRHIDPKIYKEANKFKINWDEFWTDEV